jgi:hypothetical protein
MTLAAYWPSIRGGFIWDDDRYAANPILEQPDGLTTIWTLQPAATQYYKEFPLVYTTFWLERHVWGLDPLGYHVVNLVLHVANALFVWLLLKRLQVGGAWIAAVIFALHPVQVESVAWISERKNVLSGLGYLLALAGYLRFEDSRGRGWYAGALVLFLAALLSKPVTCTLPVILLILRWQRGLTITRRDIVNVMPFFALALAIGVFTLVVERSSPNPATYLSLAQRLLVAGRALWFYPAELVWPANLAFSYPRWSVDVQSLAQWSWVAAAVAAGAGVWRARHRLGRPFVGGLMFYVITISPVIGLVGVYTFRYAFVADHYQYLASIGLIAAATGSVVHLLRRAGIVPAPASPR